LVVHPVRVAYAMVTLLALKKGRGYTPAGGVSRIKRHAGYTPGGGGVYGEASFHILHRIRTGEKEKRLFSETFESDERQKDRQR
jgi:hypothetical protein